MNLRSKRSARVLRIMIAAVTAWIAGAGCSDDVKPEIDASFVDSPTTPDARQPENDAATADKSMDPDAATPDVVTPDVAVTSDVRGPDSVPDSNLADKIVSADKIVPVDITPDPNCSCIVFDSAAPPLLQKNGLLTVPCYCARDWKEFGGAPPACLSFDESIDCQSGYGRSATIETFKNCALVAVHFGTLGPDDRIFQSQTHELVGALRGTDYALKCSTSEVATIRAGVLPAPECETAELRVACPDAGPLPDAADVTTDRATTDSDAATDADIVSQCRQLQSDWHDFVQQHRSCTDVSECVIVGGAGACDCGGSTDLGLGRPIGNASGDAISSSASTAAQAYLQQFTALGCNYLRELCVYDAALGKNLRCESGQCKLTDWSCLSPPDASLASAGW